MEKRILLIAVVLVFAAFLAHSYESNLQRLTGQQIATFSDDIEEQSFFVEQSQRESYRSSRILTPITQIGNVFLSLFGVSSSSTDDDKNDLEKPRRLTHIGEGPETTKLISEEYQRAESSGGSSGGGEGPLGGGEVHNPIPGPDQSLYFRGKRHSPQPGPEQSRMVWEDFKHNPEPGPEQSVNFPPSWKHAPSGSHKSEMWPPEGPPPEPRPPREPGKKHVEEGHQKTELIPEDWKHITDRVFGPTEWVPPYYRHVTDQKGPTGWTPEGTKHVTDFRGPTEWVPGNFKHVTDRYGPTQWVPPDHKHVTDERGPTRWVPPFYEHIEEGPDKTKWRDPPKQSRGD